MYMYVPVYMYVVRFQEACQSAEVSFHDRSETHDHNDDEEAAAAGAGGAAPSSSEEKELKLLEGELASIQELSFAFRRAGSRLVELSSRGYLEGWQLQCRSAGGMMTGEEEGEEGRRGE
jgi:hypothetical protein